MGVTVGKGFNYNKRPELRFKVSEESRKDLKLKREVTDYSSPFFSPMYVCITFIAIESESQK